MANWLRNWLIMAALNPLTGRQRSYVYFQVWDGSFAASGACSTFTRLMLVNLLFLLVVLVIVFASARARPQAPPSEGALTLNLSGACW